MDWASAASRDSLRARAALYQRIRAFFAVRDVLEVETPLLCTSGVTDLALEPLVVPTGQSLAAPRYLQTSPEYAMKRLLASGSGAIYQLGRAFRDGEVGRRHNPEFTLLEWYRPGFDHQQLMDEVTALVTDCIGDRQVSRISYRSLLQQELGLDPMQADATELERCARAVLDVGELQGDRDLWLDLLMSHVVEPRLAGRGLVFVYDYPASQASLARVAEVDGVRVGHRFELYVDGLELANGYWELADAEEQRRRFDDDNRRRRDRGLPQRPVDEYLLAALAAGLPDCAGVALGVDRLLMCASGETDIRRVLAFDWQRS